MSIYAHDWEILGDDRIRRWPSKIGEKRGLTIRISSWVGTAAIGAKHYNLRIEEAENMWWSEKENDWVRLSCDTHSGGYTMDAAMLKPVECIKLARAWLDIVCGKGAPNHDINLDIMDEETEDMLLKEVPWLADKKRWVDMEPQPREDRRKAAVDGD